MLSLQKWHKYNYMKLFKKELVNANLYRIIQWQYKHEKVAGNNVKVVLP